MVQEQRPERRHWLTVTLGFLLLYFVLTGVATATKSNYGEAGALVFVAVLLSALLIETEVSRNRQMVFQSLGYVPSKRVAVNAALVIMGALLLALVVLIQRFAPEMPLRPLWPLLVVGLFFQGGLAEETVFRGFLFRHFRTGRSFWHAAVASMVPFTLAHLYMFWTMPPVVAFMAVLVAVSTSFPLAKLFDMSGGSVWPVALVHFSTHLIKLVVWPESAAMTVQLVWMAIVLLVPWSVFWFARRDERS